VIKLLSVIIFFAIALPILAQGPSGAVYYAQDGQLIIADEDGIIRSHSVAGNGAGFDFKRQGNSLTYFVDGHFVETDLNFSTVHIWEMVGIAPDIHDFQLLDSGNALMMAYKRRPYDFSPYGGSADGQIASCLVQEITPDGSLVWEWDSFDHTPITYTNRSLTATAVVDYDHCNAIEQDHDGNVLVSSRHLDSITKFDPQTGQVVWRLGGIGNQFDFVNDVGFAMQHDIRRLPNGHITLFDNGQPGRGYSRAVEYEIDEVNLVITRTWEYTGPFAFCCSNAQRLENGNTFVNFGPARVGREVTTAGIIEFEILFDAPGPYRAFVFERPPYRVWLPVVMN